MNKGMNMQSVKNENRQLILYLLNSEGELSRKDISKRLSLTPAAVTKICAELIEKGFIKETGEAKEQSKSGRREMLLRLCLDEKLAFCINAERDSVTFSICTLEGRALDKKTIAFSPDFEQVLSLAKEYLLSVNRYRKKLIGAGVCIIGSPDEDDFGIWKDKALKEKLEAELSLDVVIENNVKAFALGELIYGEIKNPESVLFLKWGPGIGSAIIANGKIYTGNDSSVAEIGHYIVNAGGVKCRCGRFGCLETEASEKVILSELNTKQTLDEVLKNCDNDTMNIIAHKIDMVALALTNTATILNTDNIVLFGTMFNNEIIAEKLKRQCLRYNSNFKEETIRLSSLNSNSGYIGACAVCAKELFFEKAV